jgi:hypothetical protein
MSKRLSAQHIISRQRLTQLLDAGSDPAFLAFARKHGFLTKVGLMNPPPDHVFDIFQPADVGKLYAVLYYELDTLRHRKVLKVAHNDLSALHERRGEELQQILNWVHLCKNSPESREFLNCFTDHAYKILQRRHTAIVAWQKLEPVRGTSALLFNPAPIAVAHTRVAA